MSATWFIYSPLAPQQMRSLEEECDSAIEEHLEKHPDCDDQLGEILAGGALPTPDEVRRAYGHYQLPLAPAILDRLGRCRSVMTIDRPGDLDADALQVSVLRFLLERAGEALVMRNDYPLEPAEELLAEIARKQCAPGFLGEEEADDDDAPGSSPARSRPGRGGEAGQERAARLEQILHNARENPDLTIDVVQVLRRTPDLGRRYAALLLEEGAMPDAQAAEELRAPEGEVTAAAEALDRALRGLSG